MKRHRRTKLSALFALLALYPLFAAEPRLVKVGALNNVPVIFKDNNGEFKGLYVDLLTEIGRKENIRFEYVFGTWQDGLDRIKTGEVDLLTSVAYTKERSLFMDFCQNPLLTVWGELYTLKTSEINGILEIGDKKIAVLQGDINAKIFQELTSSFNIKCQIVEFPSYDEVFKAIASRKADAGVAGVTFGSTKQRDYGLKATGVVFNPLNIYFTTAKGKNADLRMLLDTYLDEWKHQEYSVFSQAKQKWLYGSVGSFVAMPAWLIDTLIAVTILALVALAFIVLLRLQIKRATKEIKSLLEEKNIILKEVHHRIKNNMNTLRSLLSLQAATLTEPSAIMALEAAGSRVGSMMVLYDSLYRSANFKEIAIGEYFPSLIDQIVFNFPNSDTVRVESTIADFTIGVTKLQPLGIIMNELLTNIMKYAFRGRETGLISVSASLNGHSATVIIQDDGNGMPETVDFENSTGFGLMLVGTLTKQINGNIRIERKNGTKVILEFEV